MKNVILALIVGVGLIGGAFYLSGDSKIKDKPDIFSNVEMFDGKQIIKIDAKGGYTPKNSVAKAGVPTILRFNTKGTFDCSSSISLPSIDVNQLLPNTGSADFEIGIREAGVFTGGCSMGMYSFSIDFK